MTDELERDAARQTLDKFCEHVVALSILYRRAKNGIPEGASQFAAISGVVVEFQGSWLLLTAGHVIEEIDNGIEAGTIVVDAAVLVDSFRSDAAYEEPIPFDYSGSLRLPIQHKSGLDFALVRLGWLYALPLQKQGIVPLPERYWATTDDSRFDHYYIVGLPGERQSMDGEGNTSLALTLLRVDEADSPPEYETALPRFVGRIPDLGTLQKLNGMSGGPIFGVILGQRPEYRLVAVQSTWLPRQRIVFGCHADMIRQVILEWLALEADGA